jgi:hypothetical protein
VMQNWLVVGRITILSYRHPGRSAIQLAASLIGLMGSSTF